MEESERPRYGELPLRDKRFLSLVNVQAGSGPHYASYSLGVGESFFVGNTASV